MTSSPQAGPVAVLAYHEIADRHETSSRLAVPPSAFCAQLEHLAANGFTAVSAAALAARLSTAASSGAGVGPSSGPEPWPERPVVLTFDDGFADFHSRALPLLLRLGFTATVFVTTGWVDGAGPSDGAEPPGRMLSWAQIHEAAEAGVEIGGHSHGHWQLDQLAPDQLREDLRISKDLLEDRLGRTVAGMAYPFGYSNAQVRSAARAAGNRYGYAVANRRAGPGDDLFALPRVTVKRSTDMGTFARIFADGPLPFSYVRDRALTKGWAMVRRSRAAIHKVTARG